MYPSAFPRSHFSHVIVVTEKFDKISNGHQLENKLADYSFIDKIKLIQK
jgi:hypothetical protein